MLLPFLAYMDSWANMEQKALCSVIILQYPFGRIPPMLFVLVYLFKSIKFDTHQSRMPKMDKGEFMVMI